MKCVTNLPDSYEEILAVDFQNNIKLALLANGMALGIMVVLLAIGTIFAPLHTLFYSWNMMIMGIGTVVYLALHELVHGICMKCFGSRTVKYGVAGLYAYAGSQDYFGKRPYLVIALAPVVLLGCVLLVLTAVVDSQYFWGVYFVQIANLSSAAGDLYITYRFSKLPQDILVQDAGVSMVVYHHGGDHPA